MQKICPCETYHSKVDTKPTKTRKGKSRTPKVAQVQAQMAALTTPRKRRKRRRKSRRRKTRSMCKKRRNRACNRTIGPELFTRCWMMFFPDISKPVDVIIGPQQVNTQPMQSDKPSWDYGRVMKLNALWRRIISIRALLGTMNAIYWPGGLKGTWMLFKSLRSGPQTPKRWVRGKEETAFLDLLFVWPY